MTSDNIGNFSNLNPQQEEAVRHREGPLLIYAGAGSGKTMVISHRIAHLVATGVPPSSIMAVTFTNKAAKEMKERVEKLVGHRARNLLVSTFHSACVRFLRIFSDAIGYSDSFSIYDDNDKTSLLKEVIEELAPATKFLSHQVLKSKIDHLKNIGETPEKYHSRITTEFQRGSATGFRLRNYGEYEQHEIIYKCYAAYQKKLKEHNAMDFNDLLMVAVEMLETQPEILKQLQNRFQFFLVDEFQDTNPIQFKLITLLCSHTHNLCVVGDDDQSIYSWRGAEPQFILDFKKHFPEAIIVKLEQNYRSTGAIIQAASAVVAHNMKRAPKSLWTDKEFGCPINLKATMDAHEEAEFIASAILNALERGAEIDDIGVLYRTNAQSRLIEDELRRRMIPYVIYGSVRFYDRAEIKVLLAYLKLLANPDDNISFQKVIGTPRRGVGEKAVAKLQAVASQAGLSLLRASVRIACNELEADIGRGVTGLKALSQAYLQWFTLLKNGTKPSEILTLILSHIEFEKYLAATYPEDFDERWLNVVELRNALVDFENKTELEAKENPERDPFVDMPLGQSGQILSNFLQQAQLVAEPNTKDVEAGLAKAVSLMTVHSAKGLEFDNVFVAGLEEGSLPHIRSLEDQAAIEEERRLMYVAMTRARKRLTLSYNKMDSYEHRMKQPSRFLSEIPSECLERLDKRPRSEPKTTIIRRELRYVRDDS